MTGQLRRHARRHQSARSVVLGLAVMAAACVLAVADYVVSRAMVFVPAAAVAVAGAYLLGRRHGSQRPSRQTQAQRLEESARLGQAAELERLSSRSLDELVASYRHIQGQYRRQQP